MKLAPTSGGGFADTSGRIAHLTRPEAAASHGCRSRFLLRYVVRRLAFIPFAVFVIVSLAFFLVNAIPSDPARIIAGGGLATKAQIAQINARLGLSQPIWSRYIHYLGDLVHGNLGRSFYSGRPALADMGQYIPSTVELVLPALILAVVFGVGFGTLSAYYRNKVPDKAVRLWTSVSQSMPDFFLGLLLIYVFYYILHWAPAPSGQLTLIETPPPTITGAVIVDSVLNGYWATAASAIEHAILPIATLTLFYGAFFAKLSRAWIDNALASPAAEFARACGLAERKVLLYCLRVTRTSILTYGAMLLTGLIGGDAVVETIFSWNGIGQWMVNRILELDIPEIQAFVLISGLITVGMYLVLDLVVVALDHRISYENPLGSGQLSRFQGVRAFAGRARGSLRAVTGSRGKLLLRGDTRSPIATGDLSAEARSVLREAAGSERRRRGFASRAIDGLDELRSDIARWVTVQAPPTRYDVATLAAAIFLIGMVITALFVPLPHGPLATNAEKGLIAPSGRFWFGTDELGRDIFSRTIAGARTDLPLAVEGTLAALVVGVPLGLLGSGRGRLSGWLMRFVDLLQGFPLLVLALVIVALTGNHVQNVLYAIVLVNAPVFIRIIRGEGIALRESRFVEAAYASGCSARRVAIRHILPNLVPTIIAQASITAAQAILLIAAMGFLGAGITPPTPSWGEMLQEGSEYVTTGQWWTFVFPALAIILSVLAFNVLAEGVEMRFGRRRAGG